MLALAAARAHPVRRYKLGGIAAGGSAGAVPAGEAGSSLLLKADTAIELGAPGNASCGLALPTSAAGLVADGTATYIGPDLADLIGSYDFALVIMASGAELDEGACGELMRAAVTLRSVPGFMVRGTQGRLWCRVGWQARARRLSVEAICRALYNACHTMVPASESVELVVVIAVPEVVREIEAIYARWQRIMRTARQYRRVGEDTYECRCAWDCEDCPDQPVCDTIREIIVIRKGNRELRLTARRRQAR